MIDLFARLAARFAIAFERELAKTRLERSLPAHVVVKRDYFDADDPEGQFADQMCAARVLQHALSRYRPKQPPAQA